MVTLTLETATAPRLSFATDGQLPTWTGPTHFIPGGFLQVIPVRFHTMTQNIFIEAIPYSEEALAGGTYVKIGDGANGR